MTKQQIITGMMDCYGVDLTEYEDLETTKDLLDTLTQEEFKTIKQYNS